MTESVIQVRDLSKLFVIGHAAQPTNLREAVGSYFSRVLRRRSAGHAASNEEFWALKNVDFEVRQGEVLGIIGRNGAGKSTLLKIISRITKPTSGKVTMRGRVASLLEVGTGFHPELTGRENVFLNGAVLGMTRREVHRKFDQIAAFSEIENFLDTPVKRYSSGMYTRLAFAVAAHLEPEILIVDEVLAVGDASFQRKCLGKMKDVAGSGRTVMFVSHNMQSMQQLANRVVALERGSVVDSGPPSQVIATYLRRVRNFVASSVAQRERAEGLGQKIRLSEVEVCDIEGRPQHSFRFGEPFVVRVMFSVLAGTLPDSASIVVGFDDPSNETRVATVASDDADVKLTCDSDGRGEIWVSFPDLLLATGTYAITVVVRLGARSIADRVTECTEVEVLPVPFDGFSTKTHLGGYVRPRANWQAGPSHLRKG